MKSQVAELKAFAREVIQQAIFDQACLDGADIEEIAVRLGLLVATKYDPAIHGKTDLCAPGDNWLVLASWLR